MSYAPAIHATLQADATLLAILTGGIYLWDTLPRKGLSREGTPAAYISGGKMKPCAVVRGRAEIGNARIKDAGTQYRAVRQAIEIYVYNDADAGYAIQKTAAARIAVLLDQKRVANGFKSQFVAQLLDRDTTLNDAPLIRLEFDVMGKTIGGQHA